MKKQVDGIIFVGGRNIQDVHSTHIMKTAERVPVVLANHAVVGKNITCILTDEAEGTRLAIQHRTCSPSSKLGSPVHAAYELSRQRK